mmetsp:Transcript_21940/g.52433  ORF Transcript_21940/g.52433 Transcript_21940/m.52433 type:complete len:259 (+) Transcript_21940:778-1554(+)
MLLRHIAARPVQDFVSRRGVEGEVGDKRGAVEDELLSLCERMRPQHCLDRRSEHGALGDAGADRRVERQVGEEADELHEDLLTGGGSVPGPWLGRRRLFHVGREQTDDGVERAGDVGDPCTGLGRGHREVAQDKGPAQDGRLFTPPRRQYLEKLLMEVGGVVHALGALPDHAHFGQHPRDVERNLRVRPPPEAEGARQRHRRARPREARGRSARRREVSQQSRDLHRRLSSGALPAPRLARLLDSLPAAAVCGPRRAR